MRNEVAALLVGFSVVLSKVAAADEVSDTSCPNAQKYPAITQSDLNSLIGWIAMGTDYDVSSVYRDPPEMVFCQVGEVVDYEADEILVDEVLAAAYDISRRRIYLVQPWTSEDPFDRSVLLHELIHAVQLDNREWPCTGAPEWEAYLLQALWLRQQGIVPHFDWNTIHKLSQCPGGNDQ